MKSTTDAKHKLELSMRNAVEKDEMFLLFQPRLCLKTGKIVGAEALLRWRHPEQGILLPASFLPDVEENGLIIPFGAWVFDNICTMLQRLQFLGYPNLVVPMNVSFREFSQKNYVAKMAEKLNEAKLPLNILELEIKETNLMRNPSLAKEFLVDLSRLGIKLTVDEFGAGPSRLSELQKFPVDHLKISKSFIENICESDTDGIRAKTMIGIGHNMNIDVIAEGVETSSQLSFLKLNGCDQMQGNYFSEPIGLSAFEQLLNGVSLA